MCRCLAGLGEWDHIAQLAAETWRTAKDSTRTAFAPVCAEASWNLGKWDVSEHTKPRFTYAHT